MNWAPLVEAAKAEAQHLELEMYGGAPGIGVGALLEAALRRRLANLSLPASRDAWVRWLAGQKGMTVGAMAPSWFHSRIGTVDGEVYGWVLQCTSGARWSFIDRHIPGLSAVTDPALALHMALLAVEPT